MLYDLGQDVARDPGAAFRWYLRAAEGGLAEAEFNVAVMYDSGTGTPRDAGLAALWYARAAARGHARARYNLAALYAAGDGVPRNPAQAAAWYRAAATAGVAAAGAKLAGLPKGAAPAGATLGLTVAAPDFGPDALAPARAIALRDGRAELELVWQAPPQAVPVHYYIEIAALGDAPPRDVYTATLDLSAGLVTLQAEPGAYAWRVYTVSDATQSYAPSPWTAFTLTAAAAAGASAGR